MINGSILPLIVAAETCDKSTSMPSLCISMTTSFPNSVRPLPILS